MPAIGVSANNAQARADLVLGPGRCACALAVKPDDAASFVVMTVVGGARFEVGTYEADQARNRTQAEIDALAFPLLTRPQG